MPVCGEAGIRWYQVTERNKYSKHILTPNPEGTSAGVEDGAAPAVPTNLKLLQSLQISNRIWSHKDIWQRCKKEELIEVDGEQAWTPVAETMEAWEAAPVVA